MTGCGAGALNARRMRDSTHFKDRLRLIAVCCLTNWRWIGLGPRHSRAWEYLTPRKSGKRSRRSTDIAERAQKDKALLDSSDAEDVHHFVEKALVEELGPLGWKLHTGRSRNELVATDFRLFVKEAAAQIKTAIAELAGAFVALAKATFASADGGHDAHAARAAHFAFTFFVGTCGSVSSGYPAAGKCGYQCGRLPDGLGRAGGLFVSD